MFNVVIVEAVVFWVFFTKTVLPMFSRKRFIFLVGYLSGGCCLNLSSSMVRLALRFLAFF
jgi:hypothetical protein